MILCVQNLQDTDTVPKCDSWGADILREFLPPHQVSHVPFHMSCVTCKVSCVMCHVSRVTFFCVKIVELVGGGSVFNGPTCLVFSEISPIILRWIRRMAVPFTSYGFMGRSLSAAEQSFVLQSTAFHSTD